MSVIPLLFDDWTPNYRRSDIDSRRTFLDDILEPIALVNTLLKTPKRTTSTPVQSSTVSLEKNRFQANFDVQHFRPDEITVKVSGNTVTVEAKHEEKEDDHGQIYRHFVRKYTLPENCDTNRIESKLSSDGVLTLTAPIIGNKSDERAIPITQTGKPVRSAEERKCENEPQPKRRCRKS